MACAPPVRLSALAQALGFSVTGGPGRYPHRMILPCTSTPPLSVLPPSSAVASPRPWSTDDRLKERNASLELLAPSALRIGAPFCSLPRLERVSGTRCHVSRKRHPQGLATLSVVSSFPRPPRASFSSRHSWGPPFRAFLLADDRKEGFPSPLPLLPFSAKPSRPGIGAPAIASHRRSRAPFCFPGGLDQGGTSLLSWALRPLRLSLHENPARSISLQTAPFALSMNGPCDPPTAEP
jgi:hypothetical protein